MCEELDDLVALMGQVRKGLILNDDELPTTNEEILDDG